MSYDLHFISVGWFIFFSSIFLSIHLFNRSRTIFDIRIITLIAFNYFYVVPIIISGLYNGFSSLILSPDYSYKDYYFLFITIISSFSALILGLGIDWFSINENNRLNKDNPLQVNLGKMALLSIFFYGLGITGVLLQLREAGGTMSVIEGGAREYLKARVTGGGEQAILGSLLPIAALSIVWVTYHSRIPRSIKYIVYLSSILGSIGLFTLLTVRHNSVIILIGIAVMININSPRLSKLILPIISVVVLVGASILASLRTKEVYGPGMRVELLAAELSHYNNTLKIIKTTERQGYIYGRHILDIPVFLIPRRIWIDKPITSTLNRLYWPNDAAAGSEKTPGIIAEGYATLGLIGSIVFCFLCGFIASWINYSILIYRYDDFKKLLLTTVFCGWAYMAMRTGLFGKHVYTFIIMIMQFKLLVWVGFVHDHQYYKKWTMK